MHLARLRFGLAALLLSGLLACKAKQKTVYVPPVRSWPADNMLPPEPTEPPKAVVEVEPPPPPPIPPINWDTVLVFALERDSCIGHCPQYKLQLFATGRLRFEGIAHTRPLGRYETRLDTALIRELEHKLLAMQYFELAETYPAKVKVKDFPLSRSQARHPQTGTYKQVDNYYEAPKNLWRLEAWVDELRVKYLPQQDLD